MAIRRNPLAHARPEDEGVCCLALEEELELEGTGFAWVRVPRAHLAELESLAEEARRLRRARFDQVVSVFVALLALAVFGLCLWIAATHGTRVRTQ